MSREVGRRVEETVRKRKWKRFLKVSQFRTRDPKIKVPQRSEQKISNPSACRRGSVGR